MAKIIDNFGFVFFEHPIGKLLSTTIPTASTGFLSGSLVNEITRVKNGLSYLDFSICYQTFSFWSLVIITIAVALSNIFEWRYHQDVRRYLDPTFRKALVYKAHLNHMLNEIGGGRVDSFITAEEVIKRAEGGAL